MQRKSEKCWLLLSHPQIQITLIQLFRLAKNLFYKIFNIDFTFSLADSTTATPSPDDIEGEWSWWKLAFSLCLRRAVTPFHVYKSDIVNYTSTPFIKCCAQKFIHQKVFVRDYYCQRDYLVLKLMCLFKVSNMERNVELVLQRHSSPNRIKIKSNPIKALNWIGTVFSLSRLINLYYYRIVGAW